MNGDPSKIPTLLLFLLGIGWIAGITYGVYMVASLSRHIRHLDLKKKKKEPPKEEPRKKIDFLA